MNCSAATWPFNRYTHEQLHVERRLDIVPGAGHLFVQPGALEHEARLAGDWFASHLPDQWSTADDDVQRVVRARAEPRG